MPKQSHYLVRDGSGPRPLEILIVEDNIADAMLAKTALRDAGIVHEATVIKDGKNALALLRCQGKYAEAIRPDVVLLDLNLPGISGYQILDEMRAEKGLQGIPVIVLSANTVPKNMKREDEALATKYLVKPTHLNQYLRITMCIREICDLVELQEPSFG
jgi:two-component system, chemotaxis family, response regulator Rcp1